MITSANGTGIYIESGYGPNSAGGNANRLLDCYMDYNDIVLVTPIYLISIEDTFFLGGGTLRLKTNKNNAEIQSFNFKDSNYQIGHYDGPIKSTVMLDTTEGKFAQVTNVVIDGIQIHNGAYQLKSTKTKKSLTMMDTNKFVFNFTDDLLFDNMGINEIDYSIKMNSNSTNKFVQHAAFVDDKNPLIVTVETDKICSGTVYISVDQSVYDPLL